MHETSIKNAGRFIETYVKNEKGRTLVDLGSQSYDGQFILRQIMPSEINYLGLDFQEGYNVDIVMHDPYIIPLEDNSVDYIISTSCFEHSEFFWLTFLEIMRVLKPDGLFYLNSPSNGPFHRYPVDCWRFYPDSAVALSKWGNKNGYNCEVLEQYTGLKENEFWFDYVSVFIKGRDYIGNFDKRIIDTFSHYMNASCYPKLDEYRKYAHFIQIGSDPNF